MFDALGRRVELFAGKVEVAGHVRFPQSVRTDDVLREAATRVGQFVTQGSDLNQTFPQQATAGDPSRPRSRPRLDVGLQLSVVVRTPTSGRRRPDYNAQLKTDIETRPRTWAAWIARRRLLRKGLIQIGTLRDELTDAGRRLAQDIVRSHRLWESYMARHFDLPGEQLHATAERVEHFLDPALQAKIAEELNQPSIDPHGKSIPPVVE